MTGLLLACVLLAGQAEPVPADDGATAAAEELAPPPTSRAAPARRDEPASPGISWTGWGADVVVGTSVGLLAGVGIPLVLGFLAEGALVAMVASMVRNRTGWEDLVAVVLAILGTAVIVPGTLLLVPICESVTFLVAASASTLVRRAVTPLQSPLDQADAPLRKVVRAVVAPLGLGLAALPVLAGSLAVVLAGFSMVPLALFFTNSIGIARLGENFLPLMLGGAVLVAFCGVLLHGLLAVTVRPALWAAWQLVDLWLSSPMPADAPAW